MGTKFSEVYNAFLGKITDDMYMELTPQDTLTDLQNLLKDAIPGFEFPKQTLEFSISNEYINSDMITDTDFVISTENNISLIDKSAFSADLTYEEINILALLMMRSWLQRQVTTIENTRMKYSGADFKMTSQANHLAKLLTLQNECRRQSHHMQRLYKRRRTEDGKIRSNWDIFGTGVYNAK